MQPTDTVDAHHHLWHYSPAEYGWIRKEATALQHDFTPADLHREMRAASIGGSVAVQARQTLEETEMLLQLAEANPFIRGLVGWADLASRDLDKQLARFQGRAKLKGIRHVLHDEPDDFYMLREDFNAGVARLASSGLVYDILIVEKHLPQTIEFVDRHPNQVFVVDHIAKPRIRDGALTPWRDRLKDLARRPHVYCKLSGVLTETNHNQWRGQKVEDYMEVATEAFGPRRIMFGSDWPVLLQAASYGEWASLVRKVIARLSETEQARIMGGTAIEAYRL